MATVRFQLRRDTADNWFNVNPILGPGEPGLETDTLLVKYGDGATRWNGLAYSALDLPAVLEAYSSGDMPSAFTLSVVGREGADEWREAISAQASSDQLDTLAGVTPIADGDHTVGGITITTVGGLITAIA